MATVRKTTTSKTTPSKAPAKAIPTQAPAPAPAPLNVAQQSQADYAAALAVLREKEDALTKAAAFLEDLENRRHQGDESVTHTHVREAQGEVEDRNIYLNAARTKAKQAERALVNTSTALADALAPYLGKVIGLAPSTTWEKYDGNTQPDTVPAAVLVQTEKENASSDGFLSGTVAFYFTRTRLHTLPNASALAESLEGMGVQARVSDGFTTQHPDESMTHSFRVNVAELSPEIPVISAAGAVSETSRRRIGFAIGEVIEQAHKMHDSARDMRRPTIGGNSMAPTNSLMGVLVRTGLPSLYSDRPNGDGTRTVTALVNAECVVQYRNNRAAMANALLADLSSLVEKAVGRMIAGAGRISAVAVDGASIADDQGSVSAQVLVSYVSILPTDQEAPTVTAPSRTSAENDPLADVDDDLKDYALSLARQSDIHGDRMNTHPGQQG